MKYKVDVVRIRENSITLNGWALGKSPESKVTFRVEDEHCLLYTSVVFNVHPDQ